MSGIRCVRKVNDIRHELPQGVQGPFFNDEFGDTFGNIYVLTGADYDYATLKEYADRLQLQLQRVKDVAKVNLVGLQDQKIWIEIIQHQSRTTWHSCYRDSASLTTTKQHGQAQVFLKPIQTVFRYGSAVRYTVLMS